MIFFHVLAAWFLADLMSGLVHWVMDKRLSRSGMFPGVALDNIVHHLNPTAMTMLTPWENIASTAPWTVVAAEALFIARVPTFLWLSVLFLSFANLIHRYAHDQLSDVPRLVRFLQRTGIFISPRHHARHHRGPRGWIIREDARVRFCVMSNFMNPIVDFLRREKS